VVGEEAELDREGAADREEEVEVKGDVKTEKGIFCTRRAEKTSAKVAPVIRVVNISSITQVPRFAGRKLFSATATA
jgi:hypothetical protein